MTSKALVPENETILLDLFENSLKQKEQACGFDVVRKVNGLTPSEYQLESVKYAEEVSEIFPKCKVITFPEQHY
jgi:hypothetical protein